MFSKSGKRAEDRTYMSAWLNGRGTTLLHVIVGALVWVLLSSGVGTFVAHLNGDATRAERLAVSACAEAGFYNTHKGECDALTNGQPSSAAGSNNGR